MRKKRIKAIITLYVTFPIEMTPTEDEKFCAECYVSNYEFLNDEELCIEDTSVIVIPSRKKG